MKIIVVAQRANLRGWFEEDNLPPALCSEFEFVRRAEAVVDMDTMQAVKLREPIDVILNAYFKKMYL